MPVTGDPVKLALFRAEKQWFFAWIRAFDPVILRVFFSFLKDKDLAKMNESVYNDSKRVAKYLSSGDDY